MLALRRHCLQKATMVLQRQPSAAPITSALTTWRPFSSNDDDQTKKDADFFLKDEDSLPTPPSYVRDSLTGKWTDRTHAELTPKDARLLNLDDDAMSEEVMGRLSQRWKEAASNVEGKDDGFGILNEEHERVARRIQEEELALGPLGRAPGSNEESAPLSKREMQALKGYASKEYNVRPNDFERIIEDDPDLLPHGSVSSGTAQDRTNAQDTELDLAYLNPRLNKMAFSPEGAEHQHSDPFADLLPTDFNTARKVNRRNAKPLPREALHHNNLVLLRRYSTPGGKIMNRVQSRLGAKDQRKVAKLIKRARHLGLIPHMGQWKFEEHGYIHNHHSDEDETPKEWELELEKRGLWPLADETPVFKKYYGLDDVMDHIGGNAGTKKREEFEELLELATFGERRGKTKDESS